MTDYFALLNEPRRPWLDPEALKETFLTLSAAVHPDRVHNLENTERDAAQESYVELNAAYNCLREPKGRLRHLLQLELGNVPKDIQQTPPDLIDLFMEVGEVFRSTDSLLAEKTRTTSPLLQVQMFERSQMQTERLIALQQRLNGRRDSLVQSVREIDAAWDQASLPREETLNQLHRLLHLFGFYDRWIAQVNERVARLSF